MLNKTNKALFSYEAAEKMQKKGLLSTKRHTIMRLNSHNHWVEFLTHNVERSFALLDRSILLLPCWAYIVLKKNKRWCAMVFSISFSSPCLAYLNVFDLGDKPMERCPCSTSYWRNSRDSTRKANVTRQETLLADFKATSVFSSYFG